MQSASAIAMLRSTVPERLKTLLSQAVADGVVPGLVVLVGHEGKRMIEVAGHLDKGRPDLVTPETVYDLASLTKALWTSVLAMKGVQRGILRLGDKVADGIPGFGGAGKDDVQLRHLLSHSSGLPAHRILYAQGPVDTAQVVARVAAEPLVAPPGARSVYSDLGFILLGDLLERRLGGRLDLLEGEIWGRAGLPAGAVLGFAPVGCQVAPTEQCPVRGRMVCGEVHDLNAWAMGGVAGHAGLFGNVDGVATLVESLLAGVLVDPQVLRAFWTAAGVPGSTWRLGWDGPSVANSLAGDLISRDAVGHLGFTGCSIWIDPARNAFVLMLSNRVHPAVRPDTRFAQLRRAINDEGIRKIMGIRRSS